ncbi:MAG: UrcA family protein [Proteobacteria bacterium]|nr:UrcA family protein [Pseudomonadota bacterium]
MKTSHFNRTVAGRAAAALLALGTAAALTGTAAAATPDEPPSVRVGYGDLNLDTDAGAHVLYRRLRAAARQVCSDDADSREVARAANARACQHQAIERAVRTVGSPRLAAWYERMEMPG